MIAQVAHRTLDLLFDFAETDHKTALGQAFRAQLLGVAQHLQGALVLRLRADRIVEAGNSLDVVVEGVRTGINDGLDRVAIPLEVGGQDLDGAAGNLFPDRTYRCGEDGSPAV